MFLKLIQLLKGVFFFTGSYSNNVFPPPLSLEEENKYISLMETGDSNARNKLVEHNLRLVAHIVKKFEGKEKDTDDLISIGTIGLIKGIDSFNSNKNIRITTYAARCIENAFITCWQIFFLPLKYDLSLLLLFLSWKDQHLIYPNHV